MTFPISFHFVCFSSFSSLSPLGVFLYESLTYKSLPPRFVNTRPSIPFFLFRKSKPLLPFASFPTTRLWSSQFPFNYYTFPSRIRSYETEEEEEKGYENAIEELQARKMVILIKIYSQTLDQNPCPSYCSSINHQNSCFSDWRSVVKFLGFVSWFRRI